jgi:hypothetical protein
LCSIARSLVKIKPNDQAVNSLVALLGSLMAYVQGLSNLPVMFLFQRGEEGRDGGRESSSCSMLACYMHAGQSTVTSLPPPPLRSTWDHLITGLSISSIIIIIIIDIIQDKWRGVVGPHP